MKNIRFTVGKALGIGLFAFVLLMAGCDNGGGENSNNTVWLNDLKNPFIGKWESEIPSMDNARMVSEFRTDGTHTVIFPDLPQEYGGGVEYTGAYLVIDNVMVTFMSGDGGIGGYTFKVVDNNIINVTEIDNVKNDGSFESGNTSTFTRFPNSTVNKKNQPFNLTNELIGGTWSETVTPYKAKYQFKVDGTGIMEFIESGNQVSFPIAYSTFHDDGIDDDVLVVFMQGANTFTAYAFTTSNVDTISVKEIITIDIGQQGPTATYGPTINFTR